LAGEPAVLDAELATRPVRGAIQGHNREAIAVRQPEERVLGAVEVLPVVAATVEGDEKRQARRLRLDVAGRDRNATGGPDRDLSR
jgi:hypothetical protein